MGTFFKTMDGRTLIFDVIIIGGGPAGLFASSCIADKKLKVLLIDHQPILGKKLSISGSGRCNITHTGDISSFIENYYESKNFIKRSIYKFSNKDLLSFFSKRGVLFYSDENGKYFPKSNNANDILNILINNCKKNDVKIKTDTEITEIKKEKIFKVRTSKDLFLSNFLILATGGKSYSLTGSDGSGYNLAKKFGHTIINPTPGLCSLQVKDYIFKDLSGISIKNVKVNLKKNKKIYCSGDLLFTHRDLSGPAILDFSRYADKNDDISISFTQKKYYNIENEKSSSELLAINYISRKTGLPKRFLKKAIVTLGKKKWKSISKYEREKMFNKISKMDFKVENKS